MADAVRKMAAMLILVKHGMPIATPGRDPQFWPLSDEGRRGAETLAATLAPYAPARLVASPEPKARDTGLVIAERLGIPANLLPGLREHDRTGEPWEDDYSRVVEKVRALFAEPSRLVFGRETADEARRRFASALDPYRAEHPGTLIVAAHGTVISLYAAARCGLDGFALWQRLGLPSAVVLDAAGTRVVEVIESVASA